MSTENLLVVGAGPGGYTAAFLAADRGMNVTLVDAGGRFGGVCLQRGCIPSKTLLHVAKLISEARQARDWGIDFGDPVIDISAVRDWKNKVVDQLVRGLVNLCRQRKVRWVPGHAVLKNSHTAQVSGKEELTFDHAILATGSVPIVPQEFAQWNGHPRIWDSTSALELESIPRRLLIIGGGYIGLEMGTVYAALGSRVTVVEMTDGLLPGVDRDLVRPLEFKLKKEFEAVRLNTRVTRVEEVQDRMQVTFDGKAEEEFDRILVSVGRKPNSGGLGLENTQVETDEKGFVRVDDRLRTAEPSILAIGDLAGGAMLAHKASYEARLAVDGICGEHPEKAGPVMPAVVFTDPEIAWCGWTENEARAAGKAIVVAKVPWGASGRAASLGRTDGTTKLIIEPETQRILGAGIVGSGAGELIAEAVLAVEMGASAHDLAKTIHPHPTLSETLKEAAESFLGNATHIFKRR